MFFVDGALGIGTMVGNVISSYILAEIGTIGVFATAASIDLLALLYLLFFVGESLKLKHERKEVSLQVFWQSFESGVEISFNLSLVKIARVLQIRLD